MTTLFRGHSHTDTQGASVLTLNPKSVAVNIWYIIVNCHSHGEILNFLKTKTNTGQYIFTWGNPNVQNGNYFIVVILELGKKLL